MKKQLMTASLAAMVVFAPVHTASAADASAVISTYSDIAAAKYSDALTTAKTLKTAVEAFTASPTSRAVSFAAAAAAPRASSSARRPARVS